MQGDFPVSFKKILNSFCKRNVGGNGVMGARVALKYLEEEICSLWISGGCWPYSTLMFGDPPGSQKDSSWPYLDMPGFE